jgi:hypothetical protein
MNTSCNQRSEDLQFPCITKTGNLVIDPTKTWVNLGLKLQFLGQ